MQYIVQYVHEVYQIIFKHFGNEMQMNVPNDDKFSFLVNDVSDFSKIFDEINIYENLASYTA